MIEAVDINRREVGVVQNYRIYPTDASPRAPVAVTENAATVHRHERGCGFGGSVYESHGRGPGQTGASVVPENMWRDRGFRNNAVQPVKTRIKRLSPRDMLSPALS
jgi:hypothetical protein